MLLGLSIAVPAFADEPPVLLLPTATVAAIRQYLGNQPHDAVAGLIDVLEACVRVQVPHGGPPDSPDACPAVTQELARRAAANRVPEKK